MRQRTESDDSIQGLAEARAKYLPLQAGLVSTCMEMESAVESVLAR